MVISGTHQCLSSFSRPSVIHTLSSSLPISDHIITFGTTLDSNLTLNKHASSVCKSAYYCTIAFRHIRPVLTTCGYGQSCRGIVNTKPPSLRQLHTYRNFCSNIYKLQLVQNCLARVVLQDNYNSATSFLSELYWLPVNQRINFEIATLMYQSLGIINSSLF